MKQLIESLKKACNAIVNFAKEGNKEWIVKELEELQPIIEEAEKIVDKEDQKEIEKSQEQAFSTEEIEKLKKFAYLSVDAQDLVSLIGQLKELNLNGIVKEFQEIQKTIWEMKNKTENIEKELKTWISKQQIPTWTSSAFDWMFN